MLAQWWLWWFHLVHLVSSQTSQSLPNKSQPSNRMVDQADLHWFPAHGNGPLPSNWTNFVPGDRAPSSPLDQIGRLTVLHDKRFPPPPATIGATQNRKFVFFSLVSIVVARHDGQLGLRLVRRKRRDAMPAYGATLDPTTSITQRPAKNSTEDAWMQAQTLTNDSRTAHNKVHRRSQATAATANQGSIPTKTSNLSSQNQILCMIYQHQQLLNQSLLQLNQSRLASPPRLAYLHSAVNHNSSLTIQANTSTSLAPGNFIHSPSSHSTLAEGLGSGDPEFQNPIEYHSKGELLFRSCILVACLKRFKFFNKFCEFVHSLLFIYAEPWQLSMCFL